MSTNSCICARVCQTSSVQKGLETVTRQPSTKVNSIEQPVATANVNETDDKGVQGKERMATKKATAASKEKVK